MSGHTSCPKYLGRVNSQAGEFVTLRELRCRHGMCSTSTISTRADEGATLRGARASAAHALIRQAEMKLLKEHERLISHLAPAEKTHTHTHMSCSCKEVMAWFPIVHHHDEHRRYKRAARRRGPSIKVLTLSMFNGFYERRLASVHVGGQPLIGCRHFKKRRLPAGTHQGTHSGLVRSAWHAAALNNHAFYSSQFQRLTPRVFLAALSC